MLHSYQQETRREREKLRLQTLLKQTKSPSCRETILLSILSFLSFFFVRLNSKDLTIELYLTTKAKENWNKHTNRYINDKYNSCDFFLLFINESWKRIFRNNWQEGRLKIGKNDREKKNTYSFYNTQPQT